MEVDASDDHLYELLYIIIIYSGLCYLLRFSLLAVCSAGISSEQISAPRDFFSEICYFSHQISFKKYVRFLATRFSKEIRAALLFHLR
jgi:hypothetical protein